LNALVAINKGTWAVKLNSNRILQFFIGSVGLTQVVQNNGRKGKGFPYLSLSVGPGADPGVQAVSPQVISHPPGCRLPLLSAGPAVTFPVEEHHHPLAGTKLYC